MILTSKTQKGFTIRKAFLCPPQQTQHTTILFQLLLNLNCLHKPQLIKSPKVKTVFALTFLISQPA